MDLGQRACPLVREERAQAPLSIGTHQTVRGILDLLVNRAALLLGVLDRDINDTRVLLLLRGSQDQRRVRGRILGFVDGDACENVRGAREEEAEKEADGSARTASLMRRIECGTT